MTYHLTSQQRCVLSDCVRSALVGWLLTDPHHHQSARGWQYKATTVAGFSFSRFVTMAMNEAGSEYRPVSPASRANFPLGISETAALCNDIELEIAGDGELLAAGIIAAHSPFGQPSVCSRDWRTYTAALKALGLSIDDDRPNWRLEVRAILYGFRMAVQAASVSDHLAAE
jgi:hypothetical protein